MDMTGFNLPEPCYGIGIEKLCELWIELEQAQLAAGMIKAARSTKIMRRQLQEAANLVVDPEHLS